MIDTRLRPYTRAKRAGVGVILALMVVAGVETACRLYFAALIGRSVLFYGTPLERSAVTSDEHTPLLRNLRHRRMSGAGEVNHSVRHTENHLANYAKYYPHQARSTYDVDSGEVYSVTINERGFRGPEFLDAKAPGTIRIVSLGASSTFGYHNRDDLTYPAQLERLLNQRCSTPKYEVINLGIPHLTSAEILALFIAEGVRLRPDVVTFYEGFNDANELEERNRSQPVRRKREVHRRPFLKQTLRWIRDHFLSVAFADAVIAEWTKRYSREEIATHIEAAKRDFLENLSTLQELSKEDHFTLIVASQQARSLRVSREKIRGVTYAQEIDLVSKDLDQSGWLGRKEAAFFSHDALMQAESTWAREHNVRFVDVRHALDQQRDQIVSWVHLSHEGNRILAEQLAPAILESTCGVPNNSTIAAAAGKRR